MDYPTKGLKVWAVWGLVVFLLLIAVPVAFGAYAFKELNRRQECLGRSELDPPAGRHGAGCTPGPLWSFFDQFDSVMKEAALDSDESNPVPEEGGSRPNGSLFGAEGSACGNRFGYCGPGLVCAQMQTDNANGTGLCSTRSETSPLVLSLKLEGMSLDSGAYVGTAGTDVRVIVQAVNGEKAEARVGGKTIILSRGDAGLFTGLYTLPSGLDDSFLVLVHTGSESAAMAVPVVSVHE